MPLPLLPVAVFAGIGLSVFAGKTMKKKPVMTAERNLIYTTAMSSKDPGKVRAMSAAFGAEGLSAHADMLTKHAVNLELPEEVKAGRREAFKIGMSSKNREDVFKLAQVFDEQGCVGAADALRKYGSGLGDL